MYFQVIVCRCCHYINFLIFFFFFFFFFNDTATTEIYTLSLHDALQISPSRTSIAAGRKRSRGPAPGRGARSEEHTSELQSRSELVCRLRLEKTKKTSFTSPTFGYTKSLSRPTPNSSLP